MLSFLSTQLVRIAFLACLFVLTLGGTQAEENPAWWNSREVVLSSQSAKADDFALLNQGQLKNFALGAFQEMRSLSLAPNAAIQELIFNWGNFDANGNWVANQYDAVDHPKLNDYAPVNLGQLKAVVEPYYDQLKSLGVYSEDSFPWSGTVDNSAIANIGQAKNLFSFNLYPKISAPVITPRGGSYGVAQDITINESSGSTLVYTTDGSTPKLDAGSLYSGPISVPSTRILRVRKFGDPAQNFPSDIQNVQYVIGNRIVSGNSHSFIIESQGVLKAWGNNEFAQLGVADSIGASLAIGNLSPAFVGVHGDHKVIDAAAGGSHSLVLFDDGVVFACGANASGQVGNASQTNQSTPTQVINSDSEGLTNVCAVAAGTVHSVALQSTGDVWTWGGNLYGQLALEGVESSNVAQKIAGLSGVIAISAGDDFTLALKNDGTVWGWGNNNVRQLGIENPLATIPSPTQIPNLKEIVAISAGKDHCLALSATGQVWAWGNNDQGQLGDGTTSTKQVATELKGFSNGSVVAIAAGVSQSRILVNGGTVFAWGKNDTGQLGSGSATKQLTPIKVNTPEPATGVSSGNETVIVTQQGKVFSGENGNLKKIDVELEGIDLTIKYNGSGSAIHSSQLLRKGFATYASMAEADGRNKGVIKEYLKGALEIVRIDTNGRETVKTVTCNPSESTTVFWEGLGTERVSYTTNVVCDGSIRLKDVFPEGLRNREGLIIRYANPGFDNANISLKVDLFGMREWNLNGYSIAEYGPGTYWTSLIPTGSDLNEYAACYLSTSTGSLDYRSFAILPPEIVSRDKFLAGSFSIPQGWDSLEMEFIGPNQENLGKYGSLLGGGTTKIYDRTEDILSDADITADAQPDSQQVWFVRDSVDSRKINYYTCFNSIGAVQIKLYLNGAATPIESISHTLTAAQDFADTIDYVDGWVKGTSFDWGSIIIPPGSLQGRAAAAPSENLGIHNLTRACLIPFFNTINQVQGLSAIARGMLDGFKAGLHDDGEFLALVTRGAVSAGNWGLLMGPGGIGAITLELQMWQNPEYFRFRAVALKQLTDQITQQLVYRPMATIRAELGTSEGFRKQAWQAWTTVMISPGSAIVWTVSRSSWPSIVNGLTDWYDNFADRMIEGAEKTAWSEKPWVRDKIISDLDSTTRIASYTFGYTFGYLAEQISVGALTDGSFKVGQILARDGIRGLAKPVRTAFALSTRSHLLKSWLAGAAVSVELKLAIERGLTDAAKTPMSSSIINSWAEVIESSLARLGYDRTKFGVKNVIDELLAADNIKELCLISGRESQFWSGLARYFNIMGANASEQATRGWIRAYNRLLRIEGGQVIEDRALNFFLALRADTPAGRLLIQESLERFAANTTTQLGHEAFVLSERITEVYPTLYKYIPFGDFKFMSIDNGIVKADAIPVELEVRHYLTPTSFSSSVEATSSLQLPPKFTNAGQKISTLDRARYRLRLSTEQIKNALQIPYGWDLAENKILNRIEPLVSENLNLGSGGVPQFTTSKGFTIDAVFDTQLGRELTFDEIAQLIEYSKL